MANNKSKVPSLAQQIKDAEHDWLALINEDVKYKDAKFIIDDGRIVMIGPNEPAYYSDAAFNTPQEVVHFTTGQEPDRTLGGKLAGSVIGQRTQHNLTDPVRAQKRSITTDIVQDAADASRYALPWLLSKVTPNPLAAAAATAVTTGAEGLVNKGASIARDEPWYGESVPNIGLTAASAAAGGAANKFLSEDAVRQRQLADAIRKKLNIKDVSPELLKAVEGPLKNPGDAPVYTVGDWQKQPLTDFDTKFDPKSIGVSMRRLPPLVDVDAGNKTVPRRKGTRISDETLNRFMTEMGIKLNDTRREGIRDFLEKAWTDPQSVWGRDFYGTQKTAVKMNKADLVHKQHANPLTVKNEAAQNFAGEMYRQQAVLDDPELQKKWDKAKAEYAARENKNIAGGQVVTPQRYANMGKYKLPVPFTTKSVNVRGPLRAAATFALPIITEAVGKYLLPKGDK